MKIILFDCIYLHIERLFLVIGNVSKENFQEKVWEVFLNISYHEITVKFY